jgi:hypothetical protein
LLIKILLFVFAAERVKQTAQVKSLSSLISTAEIGVGTLYLPGKRVEYGSSQNAIDRPAVAR